MSATAADHHPVDADRRLAHVQRLALLAAGRDTVIQRQVVTDHADMLQSLMPDADQWAALDRAHGTVLLRHPDRLLPGLRCISIADRMEALSPALRRRLCTLEIAVPPLAARREDAVVLARHFAQVAGETYGRASVMLTPAAEAIVAATDWPDEVRGLAAAIERAVLLSDDGVIDAAAKAGAPALLTEILTTFRMRLPIGR